MKSRRKQLQRCIRIDAGIPNAEGDLLAVQSNNCEMGYLEIRSGGDQSLRQIQLCFVQWHLCFASSKCMAVETKLAKTSLVILTTSVQLTWEI